MDINIFIRNVKLQELGIGRLTKGEQELLNFLNENLTNLNTYTNDKHIGELFLGRDKGDIILSYRGREYLYVSYDKIWIIIRDKFDIRGDVIRTLMRYWIGNTLDLDIPKVITPFNFYDDPNMYTLKT